jgi:AbrB family looped-hinge helix DNA binding protein
MVLHMNTGTTHQEITQVTRKGQVTVPVAIRKALGLKEGDKVAFTLAQTGKPQVTLQPVPSATERTFGILASDTAMLSPQEERRVFAEEISEEAASEDIK